MSFIQKLGQLGGALKRRMAPVRMNEAEIDALHVAQLPRDPNDKFFDMRVEQLRWLLDETGRLSAQYSESREREAILYFQKAVHVLQHFKPSRVEKEWADLNYALAWIVPTEHENSNFIPGKYRMGSALEACRDIAKNNPLLMADLSAVRAMAQDRAQAVAESRKIGDEERKVIATTQQLLSDLRKHIEILYNTMTPDDPEVRIAKVLLKDIRVISEFNPDEPAVPNSITSVKDATRLLMLTGMKTSSSKGSLSALLSDCINAHPEINTGLSAIRKIVLRIEPSESAVPMMGRT